MQARMLEDSCVALQNLVDSHCIVAQQSEPVIRLTTQWLKHPKDDHGTLAEFLRGKVPDQIQCQYTSRQKDFTLNRGLLYLKTMPSHSNEDILAFMVPSHKRRAAIDGCHRYTGHQGLRPDSQLNQGTILVARNGARNYPKHAQLWSLHTV